MAVQIISGDLAVNKKQVIIEKLIKIHEKDPQAEIYYIVPEHLKFDMEKVMLQTIASFYGKKEAGMIQIQVASFTRLAWFMTRNLGIQSNSVSKVGLSMIIRQILAEQADHLQVYRGQVNYQGFVDKLLELFEELIHGNIQDQDLENFIEEYFSGEGKEDLLEKQRMIELILLYRAFIDKLSDFQLSQYQQMDHLIQALNERNHKNKLYIVIDHYYYFNADQMSLILNLAKIAEELWICLPISHYEIQQNYSQMFDSVINSYQMIKNICQLNEIEVKEDWLLEAPLFNFHPKIYQLSQAFKASYDLNNHSIKQANFSGIPLEIWETDSIQTEVQHIANQIHYLVSQEGYRYKDIIVVTRDLERYLPLIKAYFRQNDIPVFIDHTTEMRHHPFTLLMEGLLGLASSNFSYEDLMTVLNSNLIMPPFIDELDLSWTEKLREKNHQLAYFENIILANGYFAYRLTQADFKWDYPEAQQDYVNANAHQTGYQLAHIADQWRHWIIDHLKKPLDNLKNYHSGQQLVEGIYQWIESLSICQLLQRNYSELIDQGNIEEGRRSEQVWQVFIELLEEFYALYQDKYLSFALFAELLLTGLNEATYHIIPPSLDQVTLSNMVSPQVQPYPVCFVMGLDQQALPQIVQVNSLFTREYRQALSEHLLAHQYLMDINQAQHSQELMLAYQLLLNGREKLFLSYAMTVNDQTLSMSVYLENILAISGLEVLRFSSSQLMDLNQFHVSHFGKYNLIKANLIKQETYYYEKEQTYPTRFKQLIQSILEFEERENDDGMSLKDSLEKIAHANQLPDSISPQVAIDLYGEDLYLSVSRIEQYYQDPYSYFLTYGLRLKERPVFELDVQKTGNYVHDYLDTFTQFLHDKSQALIDLSGEELSYFHKLTQTLLLSNNQYNIFTSHPSLQAIYENLNLNLLRFIQLIQSQNQYVPFSNLQSEATFGMSTSSKTLQGLEYHLDSGGKLKIHGKIDRIDKILIDKHPHLQIIDYKSGNKSFKARDMYYGLDLQIATYLQVALANYKDSKAFGAFYQPLNQSYTKVEDLKQIENIQAYKMNQNRLQGFVTVDEENLQKVDKSFSDSQKNSLIYIANLKNNGEYTASSKYFSQDNLQIILAYLDYLYVKAGNEIQAGNIQLAPYKDEKFTPSLMKDYRVISGFDATVNYQAYREKKIEDKEILEAMSDTIQKKGGMNNGLKE